MDVPLYPTGAIGVLHMNLLSLEFALRLFLYELQKLGNSSVIAPVDFTASAVDTWIPETPLTNYDTLGQLIGKVNDELEARNCPERIDMSLVTVRDALAHGRVLTDDPKNHFRLLKFSKPTNGRVQVKVSIELTPDWLKAQVRQVHEEVQKIVRVSRSLSLSIFPE